MLHREARKASPTLARVSDQAVPVLLVAGSYPVVLVAAMMFMPSGISGWLEQRRIAALRKALQ